MVKINKNLLEVSPETISSWISQYGQFLDKWTGDGDGISVMIDSKGLTTNSFHNETGRGGYFHTSSGTSEGQGTTLRGSLMAYKATNDTKWRDRAMVLADAMLNVLYQGRPIPSTPDVTWVPHWLFAAKSDIKAQEYFTDLKVSFTNGKATINMPDIFKVFSVRASDATLVWDSPFSEIVGKGYDISTIDYPDDNTAVVTLSDLSVSGSLLVVYGTNTGPIIHEGENYDAYPVWRKLQAGETVCAIDSLAWSLDCFKLLFEVTGDIKWQNAFNSTSESIKHAFHIDNAIVYIVPPRVGYNIFENGIYNYSTRSVPETYTQNKNTGFIDVHYPAITSFGDGQIGKGSVNATFGQDNFIRAVLGSDKKVVMNMTLDENGVYDPDKRWVAPIYLDGSGNIQTFDLNRGAFFKSSSIFWGPNYRGNADGTVIHDANSTVTTETVIESNVAVEHVTMNKATGGWAQFLFGMGSVPSFPFNFRYRTPDDVDFVVRDANDKPWRYRLPKSTEYSLITLTADMFTSDDGLTSFPSGQFSSLLVDSATSTANIYIDYLGTLVTLPANTTYSTITLSYTGLDEVTVSIELVAPMPTVPLAYTPYVAPFDYHLLSGNINSWRGPAYSGYQTPYVWQELPAFTDENGGNNAGAVNVNMKFMADAQAAYTASTGLVGGFAPVYFWNRWDSIQYDHEPDTWGWLPAPDPNVNWGGFQYRAIDSVARVVYNDQTNRGAIDVATKFFRFIDQNWVGDLNMPTVFNEGVAPVNTYDDTHMAALLLRALTRVYVAIGSFEDYADDTKIIIKLINKTLKYMAHFHINISAAPFSTSKLEGTFSTEPAAGQWYGFWGGEIMTALSELLLNVSSGDVETFGYVYIESNTKSSEKAVSLANDSEYWGTQDGSPSLVEIKGPLSVNPEWKIVQNGAVVAEAKFLITLSDNQRLVVSSYPEDMYARVYNPDNTFSDVSQYGDFTKANYIRIPVGISTFLAILDTNSRLSVTFKEERLLV